MIIVRFSTEEALVTLAIIPITFFISVIELNSFFLNPIKPEKGGGGIVLALTLTNYSFLTARRIVTKSRDDVSIATVYSGGVLTIFCLFSVFPLRL